MNCNHKYTISAEKIAAGIQISNRLYRNGEIVREKWNLKDKPAAYILDKGNDVYCPKCERWGKYTVRSGFVFPPQGYKV